MASVDITISEDGLQASVASIGSKSTLEEISEALREKGVVHGVRSSAIVDAIAEATGKPVENVVVAQGTPPKPKVPPVLEHKVVGEGDKLPALRAIGKILGLEQTSEIPEAAKDAMALAVKKGDLLAVKSIGEVEPGRTVTDQAIEEMSEEQLGLQFQPGPGIELSSDRTQYLAKHSGYAGVFDGKVSVLPPIWISKDAMAAAYLNLPLLEESAPFSKADVEDALSAAGVSTGIDQPSVEAVGQSLSEGASDKLLIQLASGTPPEQSVDADPKFSFSTESQAGGVRQDGSIDLKARERFPSVNTDDLLVGCGPPEAGTPGMTVKGEEVEVGEPVAVELVAGENVRSDKDGDIVQLFSQIDGGASIETEDVDNENGKLIRYTVSVRQVIEVPGDVNYDTGNIDFKGNVEIKGTVVSGFKVQATGDVIVGEGIEDGVEIKADGSLTVKQGIVGAATKVETKGSVTAKFIQDATILADGDVAAEVYLRTANIQAKGSVSVEGKGKSGGIIGGETWALKSIVSKNVGAEANKTTLLAVGALPKLFDQYEERKAEAEKATDSKEAILKAMGVEALKPDLIKQSIMKNPRMKDKILQFVARANELAKTEAECIDEMYALSTKMKGERQCGLCGCHERCTRSREDPGRK